MSVNRTIGPLVLWSNFILCLHDADPLGIYMEKFYCKKNIVFDEMAALSTWKILQVKAFTGPSSPTTVFD